MKNRTIVSLLGTIATSVCVILVSGNAANAGTLRNDWNYAIDSSTDSTDRIDANNTKVGGTVFEIFGMAIKQDADNIYVALNANLPIEGVTGARSEGASKADDNHIGWGDLFFNFSGHKTPCIMTIKILLIKIKYCMVNLRIIALCQPLNHTNPLFCDCYMVSRQF